MTRISRVAIAWMVAVVLIPTLVFAAERQAKLKPGQYNPADPSVEMFEAIDAGQIQVTLIPKDSTQCRIMIENKTEKPLNVRLPDVFAGVPVLAQFDGGGFGGGGLGGGRGGGLGGGSSMNQSMGGGMGGMGGMGGGGMFNVAPEKVGQFKVTTVCLEHGKADPKPKVPYEIKPLSAVTDNPKVHSLCRMLGTGELNQRAAQASAWHLANGMSWQELAAKRLRFANGSSQPYFAPQEIQAAMQITAMAAKMAERDKDDSESSLSRNY